MDTRDRGQGRRAGRARFPHYSKPTHLCPITTGGCCCPFPPNCASKNARRSAACSLILMALTAGSGSGDWDVPRQLMA